MTDHTKDQTNSDKLKAVLGAVRFLDDQRTPESVQLPEPLTDHDRFVLSSIAYNKYKDQHFD